MGRLTLSYIGKSAEKSNVGFPIPNLDATNVEDYTENGLSAGYDALKSAVDALTLMNPTGTTVTAEIISIAEVLPASEFAQREFGVLVLMADTIGHKSRLVVPGPDLTLVAQEGTDVVDLAGTEMAALVSAIETWCVDPITGNAVTVYGARIVGRNN